MLTGLSLLCLVAGIFIIYNTTSTGASPPGRPHGGASAHRARRRARSFGCSWSEALVLGDARHRARHRRRHRPRPGLLVGMVTDSMGVIFQLRFPADTPGDDLRQLGVICGRRDRRDALRVSFTAFQVSRLNPLSGHAQEATRRPLAADSSRYLVAAGSSLIVISASALMLELGEFEVHRCWGQLWCDALERLRDRDRDSSRIVGGPCALGGTRPSCSGPRVEVAATSLFRAPTRTGVTVAAVALVLTVGIDRRRPSPTASIASDAPPTSRGFLAGDLIVSAVATEGGWLETPTGRPSSMSLRACRVCGGSRGRALPGQMFRGRAHCDRRIQRRLLRSRALSLLAGIGEGDAARAADLVYVVAAAVNISTNFADHFDVHVGDTVTLDTPTGRLSAASSWRRA